MSNITKPSGVTGAFTYTLNMAPFSEPVMRIYSDPARTVLAYGPQTLAAGASPVQFVASYPSSLAGGVYYLKFSTVFINGNPALDDTDDTLTLVTAGGSIADPFATVSELAIWLQRDLEDDDPSAMMALEVATAAMRAEARQTITRIDDDPVVLRGNWRGELWLPERPVLDITSVQIANGAVDETWDWSGTEILAETAYTWDGMGLVTRAGGGWWGGDRATVLVTYSHGYETIPGEIRGLCLQIAGQVYESTGSLITMDPVEGVDGMRDATTRGNHDLLTQAAKRLLRRYRPVYR